MSKREPGLLLDDVRVACGKIGRYLAGLDQAAFLADDKTIDAVVRNLEIVGEAVQQLPPRIQGAAPSHSVASDRRIAQPHCARLRRSRS